MRRKTGWMIGLGSMLSLAALLGALSHRRPANADPLPPQDDEACKEQNPDARPQRCDDHAHGSGGSHYSAYYYRSSGALSSSTSEQDDDSRHTGAHEADGNHGGTNGGEAESAGHAGFGGHAAGHGGGE